MISLETNIKQAIKQLEKFRKKFSNVLENVAEDLTNKFVEILEQEIETALNDVMTDEVQSKGNLAKGNYTSDISIDKKGKGDYTISIGNNSLIATNNGNIVNPFYFLELGFGFTGSRSTADVLKEASEQSWFYDINNHGQEGWFFMKMKTNGLMGTGFILKTIDEFTKVYKDTIEDTFKRYGL